MTYISNYAEDEVDWSEPTPPLPPSSDPGPCRNFRNPQAAAKEERERYFAMQRRKRLEKLVSASDALRDAPALPATRPENSHCSSKEQREVDTVQEQTEFDLGFAGEIGSVYVPTAWLSRSRAEMLSVEVDLFSDVVEDGGDTEDDDEDEWNADFARAEVEVSDAVGDGREWGVGREHAVLQAQVCDHAKERSKEAAEDAVPVSAPVAVGGLVVPAAAYVKHAPLSATQDWAYPAPSAPSPTESQLAESGFEFHNQLSEQEQIARFGDKAFRRALREVLPSLSRKQQWYAWRRVNEENFGDGINGKHDDVKEEEENTPKEDVEDSGDNECKCPATGQGRRGDVTCGKFLNECRCGDCADCNEHYLPRSVYDEDGKERGDGQLGSTEHECSGCSKTYKINRGENHYIDTWTCVCGRGKGNCQCPSNRCSRENCTKIATQHHSPALDPEVADRLSDWTVLFSHGRLVDGQPASSVRDRLDLGHDVPAPTTPRIPGLGMLDAPSSLQPTHNSIRHSVEPETPRRQLHRESTPAFEDRSPSPSPVSHKEDFEEVEMTDFPSNITSAPQKSRLPLPQATSTSDPLSRPMHAGSAPGTLDRPRSQSRSLSGSPAKAPVTAPVTAPDPSTPRPTKRGGRRKSAVQGSKVEKTSSSKSRAMSRKVTVAVKNAAENAGGKVKEAVARIEARMKGEQELTPRRSARIRAQLEREGTPKG